MAGGVQRQAHAQLGRAAAFADQQRRHRRLGDAGGDLPCRKRARLGQLQNVFLGPLGFAQLQQPQDHMQLVHELVGVGAHRLHDVLHAGQLAGQAGDLGAVAEDRHRPHDAPVAPDRHPVGQNAHMAQRFQADVVLSLLGAQHLRDGGLGVHLGQRAAQHGVLVKREHLGRRAVDVHNVRVAVDGQQPLVQGVQQLHAAQKQIAEGVRLIPQQPAFDAAGQLQAQQCADAQRRQADAHKHRQRAQRHRADGLQIQPGQHVAGHRAVRAAHGGHGAVVGAQRGLGVVQQHLAALGQAAAQFGVQCRQPRAAVPARYDVGIVYRLALRVVHGKQVDALDALHRAQGVFLQLLRVAVPVQGQRIGRGLHGGGQRVVAHALLLRKAQPQPGAGGQDHRHQNAQHAHTADLLVQRLPGGLVRHGGPLSARKTPRLRL